MKTSELIGPALDWAVAKCEFVGTPPFIIVSGCIYTIEGDNWNPSTDWAQGGPIIEREGVSVSKYATSLNQPPEAAWFASEWNDDVNMEHIQEGPTALVAAMRCYVASKLGDEIEIPEELK